MADAAQAPGARHRRAARCAVTAYDVGHEAGADVSVGPVVQHRNASGVWPPNTPEELVPVKSRRRLGVSVEHTRGVP